MLNVKSAYMNYGSMRWLSWPQTHKTVFRPSFIVITDAPQYALNRHFDIKAVNTGGSGYRIRRKTG